MADDEGVLLSVRGEAKRTVSADSVVLAGGITTWRKSKAEAVTAAAAALDRLTGELSKLGGAPLTAATERSMLTWSAFSATTHAERQHDNKTGRHELTGRIAATVELGIAVRDFGLLQTIGVVLARHDDLNVRQVTWLVDDDNPGWAAVRAEAIQAALRKGRDYAVALGSSLSSVEHVADTGLLGGSDGGGRYFAVAARAAPMSAGGRGGEDIDAPSLDPVPQELAAVIEARFRATPVALPS